MGRRSLSGLGRVLSSCAAKRGSEARTVVFCGPSGSGKSSLIRRLKDEYPDKFGFSVSHTTRDPRPGEVHGSAYHFVERSLFESMKSEGKFIESAEFSGNLYGTSFAAVQVVVSSSLNCILDIDAQGVKQVKAQDLSQPIYIFIKVPSLVILEKRLRDRKTETEDSLKRRLSAARAELEYGESPGAFDIIVVNDDFDKAYFKLKEFLISKIPGLHGST